MLVSRVMPIASSAEAAGRTGGRTYRRARFCSRVGSNYSIGLSGRGTDVAAEGESTAECCWALCTLFLGG